MIKCKNCNEEKEDRCFKVDNDNLNGLQKICKDCKKKKMYLMRDEDIFNNIIRNCCKCKNNKHIKDFKKNYNCLRGSATICRECSVLQVRELWNKNCINGEYIKPNINKTYINRQMIKDLIFINYGDQCACCGERNLDFLTVEHSFQNGKVIREKIGSASIYRDLMQRGFPKDEGIEILCWNCQMSRSKHNGICAHKMESGKIYA